MKTIFLILSLIITLEANAQKVADARIVEEWGWQPIDTSRLVLQYAYNHYNQVTETYKKETMLLEIGASLTKFYSYDTFEFALLGATPAGRQVIKERGADCFRRSRKAPKEDKLKILLEIPSRKTEFITYGNYPAKGKMLVQDGGGSEYYKYIETWPLQSWTIEKDTMEIIGYLCQKASCSWRGREYTAWFTPDIPINCGPYKFGGLPGLIMKIEDSEKMFCFEIQGIKEENNIMYLARPPKGEYMDADRKEILEKQNKRQQSLARSLNRDMQSIGNRHRVSVKAITTIETDF